MASDEDLLWDAADKGVRFRPRLLRMTVAVPCLGLFGLLLGDLDPAWALYPVAAYALVEIMHLAWDWRRLVEIRAIAGAARGPVRLRVRRAGGRITEYDPRTVTGVLIIYDNVAHDSAKLRLVLRRWRLSFARPGRRPSLAAWREACPQTEVKGRDAWWGMPGTDVD